ncbi:MAG: hypothetical protein WBG50_25710 [Desulfomonilaceae bacterium]
MLQTCAVNPLDLVVAQDSLRGITAINFLTQLLKVPWKTAAILITDQEEESVHNMTEGRGIIGHMRNFEDTVTLGKLLVKLLDMSLRNR